MSTYTLREAHQDKGIGELLTDWLLQLAKQEGCDTIMPDAYVTNSAAHRFYFREGFHIKSYQFFKSIKP